MADSSDFKQKLWLLLIDKLVIGLLAAMVLLIVRCQIDTRSTERKEAADERKELEGFANLKSHYPALIQDIGQLRGSLSPIKGALNKGDAQEILKMIARTRGRILVLKTNIRLLDRIQQERRVREPKAIGDLEVTLDEISAICRKCLSGADPPEYETQKWVQRIDKVAVELAEQLPIEVEASG